MAKATPSIIEALRETAVRLTKANNYQWGHMGVCNCGFLVQVVTQRSPREIHTNALLGHGDWSEQLNDYCPSTGFEMDEVIGELIEFGFSLDDLIHLERLSDPKILTRLTDRGTSLEHNSKTDAIAYLNAWARMLEDRWAQNEPIQSFNSITNNPVMAD